MDEAARALDEADTLKTWASLYRSFKKYAACDDGAVGEGYSESVAQLLWKDWKDFGEFEKLASSDKKFQDFVLRHIDPTLTPDELHGIEGNARTRCNAQGKSLCKEIQNQAEDALRNLN